MSDPATFDAQLYFHAAALMRKEVGGKTSKIVQKEVSILMAGMKVQLVETAWVMPTKSCLLVSLRVLIHPNLCFISIVTQCLVLSQRSEVFVSLN